MNDTVIKTEELESLKSKAGKWDKLMDTVGSTPLNKNSKKDLGELVVNMFFCEGEGEIGDLVEHLMNKKQ